MGLYRSLGRDFVDFLFTSAVLISLAGFQLGCAQSYEPVTSSVSSEQDPADNNKNATNPVDNIDPSPTPQPDPLPSPDPDPLPSPDPDPDPTPDPVACGGLSDWECEVLNLVNEQRQLNGVPALGLRSHCINEAQSHAQDMAVNGFFSHDNPITGETTRDRMVRFGISGTWGENIAWGQRSPQQVMDAWMNSDGHKRNILNSSFKSIGVGFFDYHWVQCFTGQTPDL
ncbi:MAG: hypothetical protein H6626_02370 [Pseudobdellovibrionaceae bacterium]|nr:hypothetical protein [Bdellovibrionales bacterium]USN47957.1 MAG: hypothetical protein H6626_02370 [Pseudobdellovibrionaceae bacterium]